MYELRPKAKSAMYSHIGNHPYVNPRRESLVDELSRQSQVFFDDDDFDKDEDGTASEDDEGVIEDGSDFEGGSSSDDGAHEPIAIRSRGKRLAFEKDDEQKGMQEERDREDDAVKNQGASTFIG
jgi:hypothetical protein